MSKFTELANQINGLDVANEYEDLTVSGEWLMSAVDALREAAELEAHLPRWVSVEERLPEDLDVVLCTNRFGGQWIAQYYGGEFEEEMPTHWMPLPSCPTTDN